jgi:hypothetical protein
MRGKMTYLEEKLGAPVTHCNGDVWNHVFEESHRVGLTDVRKISNIDFLISD